MTTDAHYLWLDVSVACAEGDDLELLRHSYQTEFSPLRTLALAADDTGPASLRVGGEEKARTFAGTLERAEWAYGRVHNIVMDDAHERGWQRLHAALIEIHGRGVIVAGRSGAGKTSLAVLAAERGAKIHSDEGAFLTEGRAVGLPRRLHLKDSARATLDPRLFAGSARLAYPSPVWAVDPGRHWSLPTLRPLEVAAVVLLGDPASPSRMRPMSRWETLSELAAESSVYSRAPGRLIAELTRLVETADCVKIDGYHGLRGARWVDALA